MSRKRSRINSTGRTVSELTEALKLNGRAWEEGPKRKQWSKHDIHHIKPLTPVQQDMFQSFFAGNNICAHGSAGTGKTFIAIYLALCEILDPSTEADHIIIVRSAVPTREVGHLPGTLEEKIALYELPYKDQFTELMGKITSYDDMKQAGLVQFQTTSFIRGLTWDNAVVIVDEGQNMDWHEINSIMTRLGQSSRIIFAGDLPQTDLTRKREKTGMEKMLKVVDRMSNFESIAFTVHDIVRSDFVKSWITATEEVDKYEYS